MHAIGSREILGEIMHEAFKYQGIWNVIHI
jgi:hypothetical protein